MYWTSDREHESLQGVYVSGTVSGNLEYFHMKYKFRYCPTFLDGRFNSHYKNQKNTKPLEIYTHDIRVDTFQDNMDVLISVLF